VQRECIIAQIMGGKYLQVDGTVREIRPFGSEQFCYLLPGVCLVYQNKHFGLTLGMEFTTVNVYLGELAIPSIGSYEPPACSASTSHDKVRMLLFWLGYVG